MTPACTPAIKRSTKEVNTVPYPKSYKNHCRHLSIVPNLPDLSLLSRPKVRKRGDGLIPQDYDYRYDDVLGRVHWQLHDETFLTARYYLSLKMNPPADNDDPFFWGYILWQEHFNYDVFWDSGKLQWDEHETVLLIDSYADKWRWIRPDGSENWYAERYFSTLRLLQMDWEWKRDEYGCDYFSTFHHPHHTLKFEELMEISRLVWAT